MPGANRAGLRDWDEERDLFSLPVVEAVVHAGPDHLDRLPHRFVVDACEDGGTVTRCSNKSETLGAEVHIVVFELGRPVVPEGVFDTEAGRAAQSVLAEGNGRGRGDGDYVGAGARRSVVKVSVGAAALNVNQGMVNRDAQSAGQRAEPRHAGSTAC